MKRVLLSVFLLCASSNAQTSNVVVERTSTALLPPPVPLQVPTRIGITGETYISLSDVIRAVLENNRDIDVSRLARRKAVLNLRAARGYFDPVIGGSGYSLRQVTPVVSSLGGATNGGLTQKEINANPQISGNSRWFGTTYKLDFASSRVDNSNTYNTLNPTYSTSATLRITQPLWGGLLFDQNRERLSVAKKNVAQSEEQFRQQIINLTTQAIRAYWELDYARHSLAVQIEAVRLAEQQDASNRRQVDQGTQAPVDVIQTQTQVATYQQNVFAAQQQVTETENSLKSLILPDRTDPLWGVALNTATESVLPVAVPTLDEALRDAFSSRPDVKAGLIGIQTSELDARLAREQAKPQINLTAQIGAQGLAGRSKAQSNDLFGTLFSPLFTRVNDLSILAGLPQLDTSGLNSTGSVPQFFQGGYGQSLSNLRDGRFPTVQVGLQVSFPIGNRTARAQADIAEMSKRQSVSQQQQLEMKVMSEVRNALQQLSDAALQRAAAHRAAELAQLQYESEQRQFRAGTSSVFLVLQRQSELVASKLREVRAEADAEEATAEFERTTGNTLQRHNIEIQKMTREQARESQ
jgi:HAE1 family hydrophobic/amphiphilic exporter-1